MKSSTSIRVRAWTLSWTPPGASPASAQRVGPRTHGPEHFVTSSTEVLEARRCSSTVTYRSSPAAAERKRKSPTRELPTRGNPQARRTLPHGSGGTPLVTIPRLSRRRRGVGPLSNEAESSPSCSSAAGPCCPAHGATHLVDEIRNLTPSCPSERSAPVSPRRDQRLCGAIADTLRSVQACVHTSTSTSNERPIPVAASCRKDGSPSARPGDDLKS